MKFESGRHFQMWDYTVSHKQLLLRSPRSTEIVDNVDVVFWGVRFVGIPTLLQGIKVWEASAAELEQFQGNSPGECVARETFCLRSQDRTFRICAAGAVVYRNQLDIFDSSLMYFNAPDSEKSRGEKLDYFIWPAIG